MKGSKKIVTGLLLSALVGGAGMVPGMAGEAWSLTAQEIGVILNDQGLSEAVLQEAQDLIDAGQTDVKVIVASILNKISVNMTLDEAGVTALLNSAFEVLLKEGIVTENDMEKAADDAREALQEAGLPDPGETAVQEVFDSAVKTVTSEDTGDDDGDDDGAAPVVPDPVVPDTDDDATYNEDKAASPAS